MQEFLPEVAALQTETAVPVRRQLAELLEAAVGARPSLASLAVILVTLGSLLHDAASSVVKRAVLASAVAFRCACFRFSFVQELSLLCVASEIDQGHSQVWRLLWAAPASSSTACHTALACHYVHAQAFSLYTFRKGSLLWPVSGLQYGHLTFCR